MRILYCPRCDRKFSEDEADTKSERVGEFWGSPAFMNYNICPYCRNDEISEVEETEEEDE